MAREYNYHLCNMYEGTYQTFKPMRVNTLHRTLYTHHIACKQTGWINKFFLLILLEKSFFLQSIEYGSSAPLTFQIGSGFGNSNCRKSRMPTCQRLKCRALKSQSLHDICIYILGQSFASSFALLSARQILHKFIEFIWNANKGMHSAYICT